ncbi:hypothetical protein EV122DRAFT_281529 [Schizophyllum commune]
MLYSDPNLDVDTILAIEEHLAVPEHIERDYLVSPEIPVHALVNTVVLPTPIYGALITPNSDTVFSSHGPKEDPTHTFSSITYSLPPRAFVIDVHTKARQKVLDGCQSIHDPYHRDVLYPVWIVTYWKQMYDVLEKRDQWRDGLEWLAKKKADGIKGAGEALQNCSQLPWDAELDALPGAELGASAHMLARLLGNRWLSTALVNLMIAQVDLQSKSCQTRQPTILERSRFINALERRQPNATALSRVESIVRENLSKCHLYFIVHHRSHFVAVRVRFDKRRIEYGDSLVGYPAPTEALKEVKSWAENQFGGTYTIHDTLPHGTQDDECSCGLAAVNTVAHNVLGESPWCSADSVLARVEWFNRICTAYHAMAKGRAPQKTDGSVPTIEHEARGVDVDAGRSVSGRMSIAVLLNPEDQAEAGRTEAADGVEEDEEREVDEDGGQDQDAVIDGITPLETGGPADSSLTTALVSPVLLETSAPSTPINTIFLPHSKRPRDDAPTLAKPTKKSRRTEPSPPRKANREIVESSSNVGISKSARRQKEGRAQARDGRLPDKPHLTAKFKKKLADAILSAVSQGASEPSKDPYACFEIIDMCTVRHVKCGSEVKLSAPRELKYWEKHVNKPCDGPKKSSVAAQSSGMRRIHNYFLPGPPLAPSSKAAIPSAPLSAPAPSAPSCNTVEPSAPSSDPPSRTRTDIALPCLGLTAGLERYLLRPIAGGGGAHDINFYSDKLYQKPFADLTSRKKDKVRRKQKLAWLWTTDVNNKTVYHRDCTRIAVSSTTPAPNSVHWPLGARRNGACSVCCSLWDEPSFRRVVRKPVPSDSNIKFANKEYVEGHIVHMYSLAHGLQDLMESKFSPFLRYLQLVLANKVPQDDMFAMMLKCLVIKIDKLERGKGLRNFKYPPNLVQLSMNVASKSPAAYAMLSEHVQLPELRTLRSHEAKEPRLPIGIAPDGAQRAKEHFVKVNYTGPVSLSVDDTACKESADVYRCSRRNAFFCLGLDGEEIHVPDPAALRSIIHSSASTKGKKGKKATKVRAFVIRATGVPSLPSILVAAAAISNPDAEELVEYSWSILHFLWERGINVVSYACDGASVERKVQTLLKARASYLKTYTLPHPGPGCPDIKIAVAHYGENALAFIQDAKHALKTARNNAYSGARVLSLPNHVVTLPQLWQIYSEGGPFYSRDVNRPDRQDDNAAGRFGGGDALAWVVKNHPEYRGLIAYLFVFGEFIDAYQSRTLPIHERIVMLARGMFFLDMWEKFLEAGPFSKAQHFISSEARAIMHIIFSGFMEALYIYRDELGPERPPFCPWLFGTDACEHIFGLCRQMVMDFRVVDFYYMTSKLNLGLRRLVSHRNTDSRATASGYNHAALFDTRNLSIHVLTDYSQTSDTHIACWMRQGYAEASSLFEFLGLTVDEIYDVRASSLPGFSTGVWDEVDTSQGAVDKVQREGLDDLSSESDTDSDSGADSADDWDSDLEMDEQDMRRARETLLRKLEANDLPLAAQKRVAQLTYAEAGLDAERKASIDSYSDADDEEDTMISEERDRVDSVTRELRDSLVRRAAENIADSLPAVDVPVERTNPFAALSQANTAVDMHLLVELRQRHETPEAAKASRTRTNYNRTKESDVTKKRAPTEYNKLMRAFAQVARDYKVPSDATGAQRKLRWTGKVTASGNSENAAKAADAAATKALHKRRSAFYKARAPELAQDAHINSLYHLWDEIGMLQLRGSSTTAGSCYGFVLFNGSIQLCKVLAIYRKTGGKNSKHGAVFVADQEASPISNICAVSNMAVQIFENVSHTAHVFRVVPSDLISLNIKRLTLLRSPQFLYALGGAVEPKGARQVVLASESDIHAFAELKGAVPAITRATAQLMKRRVGTDSAANGEEE